MLSQMHAGVKGLSTSFKKYPSNCGCSWFSLQSETVYVSDNPHTQTQIPLRRVKQNFAQNVLLVSLCATVHVERKAAPLTKNVCIS